MTQPWMDRMLPGSWRCVPFWVKQHSLSGGRRTAVNEFPARDQADVEDLGRKVRRYQLAIFGLGRDYFYWRDEMRAALEEEGPGQLSHPYLGELRAVVEDYTLAETPSEGGMFRVDVTFVEATNELRVVDEVDHAGGAKDAAAAVLTAAETNFQEPAAWGDLGTPVERLMSDLGRIAAMSDLEARLDSISSAGRAVRAALSRGVGFAAAVLALARAAVQHAAGSRGDAGRQIQTQCAAADALGRDWPDPANGLPAAPTAWSPTAATARQARLAQDQQAIGLLARAGMLAVLVEVAVDAKFGLADTALAAASQLDSMAENVAGHRLCGPELKTAVADLRVSLERYIRSVVVELPRRATFVARKSLPAVVIAQRLYGDARRATELVELNGISNPLFCPGGRPLEVLSDA